MIHHEGIKKELNYISKGIISATMALVWHVVNVNWTNNHVDLPSLIIDAGPLAYLLLALDNLRRSNSSRIKH